MKTAMLNATPAAIEAYVDGAAAVADMPLDAERRSAVAVDMLRIAAFAAHLTAIDLGDDIEIAGRLA